MRKKTTLIILIILILFSVYTYTREYELKDCMSYEDLSKVVKRDLIVFDEKEELPSEMLEKLAQYKVVMTGEQHYIKEYYEFLPHLTTELNKKHNFNTLLLETPQAYSWIFEDYARGIIPLFNKEEKYKYFMTFINLDIIRDHNILQSKENQINVHTIDINHKKHIFISSLKLMKDYVESKFLADLLDTCMKQNGIKQCN